MSSDIISLGKKLTIVEEPDPRLHKKSTAISEVDDSTRQLMADMVITMIEEDGIGLAAVQVGVMKNIIVVDAESCCRRDDAKEFIPKDKYLVMANPEVVELAPELCPYEEYCLSYPGLGVTIDRARWARIRYLDYYGQLQEIQAYGLLARCILHEIDHTQGKVIADYLSPLKKKMALKRFVKRSKLANTQNVR